MSPEINIATGEHGLVRVFSLSMSDAEAEALRDSPEAQFVSLRAEELDTSRLEIFPVSDLDDIGLVGYLTSGCGIAKDEITPHQARLAALDGWVMIIFSKAFRGEAQVLHPVADLTLIATLREPGVDWSDGDALVSKAATTPALAASKPSHAAMSGRVAMAVLIFIAVFTVALVWIAS